ncbi:MAG: PAS domain S-box protein [Candidatus Omnitrophica bacterium]|nr:PAS domain S-box protein [Candidatus Omnitrophota bacterium]
MQNDLNTRFKTVSEAFAITVVLIGAAVLLGWVLDIQMLKSILSGLPAMKINTAICFILSGMSLFAAQGKRSGSALFRVFGAICALIVMVIGLFTALEFLFQLDFGIDNFFIKEPAGAIFAVSPGRMAFSSAFNFAGLGIALCLANFKLRSRVAVETFSMIVGAVAFLALAAYLSGISSFWFGYAKYAAMALHATIGFILLSAGVLFSEPQKGIMLLISGSNRSGEITRRLFLFVITVPLFILAGVSCGVRAGLFNEIFDGPFETIVLIVIFCFIVYRNGAQLKKDELMRDILQEELSRNNKKYKALYDLSANAVMLIDPCKLYLGCNAAGLKIFGCESEKEFIKRTPADFSPEYQPDGKLSIEKADEMMIRAVKNGSNFFEWKHKSLSGREFWTTVLLTKINLEGKDVLEATVRDTNAAKEIEEELKSRINELEKFYTVTMERERRILELKDRIRELEERQESK